VLTCSRQPFDLRCPWPGGEENHIQIDLADPNRTIAAIETIRAKVNGRVHALVNNAGISPKGAGGARLKHADHRSADLGPCLPCEFFSPA
jgi:NAD(P)-dependent dehydrogenase (short-subunit alcohol dehydrogenase family)